jgi:hypothetical protein
MAGLVPAIHVLSAKKDVDARIRGHDEKRTQAAFGGSSASSA